jgi:hypothetical protein
MTVIELCRMSATELAEAIQPGQVSSREVDCAAPGERAEVEPHPTRPVRPATAASLVYRVNADEALTSNQ